MDKLTVRGGRPLSGQVEIHGAKNSVLPILGACLLCPERCVISRVPQLSDVAAALEILKKLGCSAEKVDSNVVVDAKNACKWQIPKELMGKMRASFTFLGALLGRFGRGEVSLPGGCVLGSRPVDYHINALRRLGVQMEEQGETLLFTWPHRHGGEVFLPFPSVGATENLLLAAVTVRDETIIHNAAREPEVADLCRFLCSMGAEITGIGTGTLYIRGAKPLHGAVHRVIPDRMESATYLYMTAACGGKVKLKDTCKEDFLPVCRTLRRMGCEMMGEGKDLTLTAEHPCHSAGQIVTAAYPGFPTDAQAPLIAALLRAEGESRVEETVFSRRFAHVDELRKFGAEISVDGNTATVRGVTCLHPASVTATDLRGGAGVLIAALQAEGESTIRHAELLLRGYADLTKNLRRLGADITWEHSASY